MNIGEANDFFHLIRGLKNPTVVDDKVLDAAERLAKRAHSAINAGPMPAEVRDAVANTLDALAFAYDEFAPELDTYGYQRPVETHEPVGGVL